MQVLSQGKAPMCAATWTVCRAERKHSLSLGKKSAPTSSGWRDKYPEVNSKAFRVEAVPLQLTTFDTRSSKFKAKFKNPDTSKKKFQILWATCVNSMCQHLSKSNHSFSFPSRKLWIFWRPSSCWPKASRRMPMGDLFSPAPSILFSSLFFMLRRRNDACANMPEKQVSKHFKL